MDGLFSYLFRFNVPQIGEAWRNGFCIFALFYNTLAFLYYGHRLLEVLRKRRAGDDSRPVRDAMAAWVMGLVLIVIGLGPAVYHAMRFNILP